MDVVQASTEIQKEYQRAKQIFPPMNSAHVGYAVLLEEVDELWDAIKSNDLAAARAEAVQVGAMALAFLVEEPKL